VFNPLNNKVYFGQQSYNFAGTGSTTVFTTQTGIHEFTATASGAITPTQYIGAVSTSTNGGTLAGPTKLAVVPSTNLIVFGDSDGANAEVGGHNHIDVGNVAASANAQWTSLVTLPGGGTHDVPGDGCHQSVGRR
jgi:hypothetical protein